MKALTIAAVLLTGVAWCMVSHDPAAPKPTSAVSACIQLEAGWALTPYGELNDLERREKYTCEAKVLVDRP